MRMAKPFFHYLFLSAWGILILPALFSCGKSDTVNPTDANIQLQVVNLSPNANAVNLFINNLVVNSSYAYRATPAYFYLTNTEAPLQIRTTRTTDSVQIYSNIAMQYQRNTRYSLYFLGLYNDADTTYRLQSIVTVDDTASLPPVGKGGKVRFLNGSPRSGAGFDIWANGTPVIKGTGYGKLSNYVTLPPGSYSFRAYAANSSVTSLGELPNITIQDGKLYTLYSRGIVGRAPSDTAAFAMSLVLNNPTLIRR
jgi:hypothetical protein